MSKINESDNFAIVSQIVSLLNEMDREDQVHILETVMTWLKIHINSVTSSSPTDTFTAHPLSRPTEPGLNNNTSLSGFSNETEMSPKQFMLEKQPKTDIERLACLAYYLTHFRNTPYFKTIDLSKLNTEAAQRKFANAATSAKNAVTCHYFVQATKKGYRQLSAIGEQAVASLPDHEAANAIMKHGRPRRATKTNVKKGTKTKD